MEALTLTKDEVVRIVAPHQFTKKERGSWKSLYAALNALPEALRQRVIDASEKKRSLSQEKKSRSRKRKAEHKTTEKKKKQKLYESGGNDEFMEPITVEQVQSCFRSFREATSNNALKREVCFVCGRRLMSKEGDIIQLDELQNKELLEPAIVHKAQKLWNGLLVEVDGIREATDGGARGFICNDCHSTLKENKLPSYSLANNLWVGPVPFELKILTIPEQTLIARHHPRCFIFKLHSRQGRGSDPDKAQLGIGGNVTLYELPTEGIVEMVEGQALPSSCEILASVISVTFVGSRKLPRNWLKNTFRVRRKVVARALQWLKENNPLYADITIDYAALERLPEDGVPDEISELVQQEPSDITALKEGGGYATEPLIDDALLDNGDNECEDEDGERVIPLHFNGVTDTSMTRVTQTDLMSNAIDNCGREETGYAVRWSRKPISTFGEAKAGYEPPPRNPLMAAYPLLWPYGVGGIEEPRPVKVSFALHVRWCLQYHDDRFAQHHSFPFVAFGIEQRREALLSARLQMKRNDFETDLDSISKVSLSDLRLAEEEEKQGKRISNESVFKLRKHVFASTGRVMGSNNCRSSYRNEIWGTCLRLGPPSLWVTINPADIHDPVMQVLAGENIDMDDFIETAGPNKDQRAKNVAGNPFAAATYFQFIMQTTLECLFGIKKTRFRVESRKGIFGRISAYFGVIEAQGRGSLHLHIFFWFHGSPNASEMEACLRSENFREKISAFIKSCIRADVVGLDEKTLKKMPKESELPYARPLDPDDPQWQSKFSDRERRLVRAVQYHVCNFACLVPRHGKLVCKRSAPWPLSSTNSISEEGVVAIKRSCGYICSYSPSILVCLGCNNNVQLLIGGKQTKDSMWYLTDYTTKKQKKSFNTSALLAKALLYHEKDMSYLDDLRERNRLLVYRCSHTLNCEMELSGQQVMSYLMGWGDVMRSHHYVPIYWAALGQYVRSHIRELANPEADTETSDETETVTLSATRDGKMYSRSQITDYIHRPSCFEHMGYLDYFVSTYEIASPADGEVASSQRRGRRRHQRGRYLEPHPKRESHIRVERDEFHNCLPSVVGPWFPRPDGEGQQHEYYCAAMLSILSPWRTIDDLKQPNETWKDALEKLIRSAPPKVGMIEKNGEDVHTSSERKDTFHILDVLSAVAFFYDSKNLASRRNEQGKQPGFELGIGQKDDEEEEDDCQEDIDGEPERRAQDDDDDDGPIHDKITQFFGAGIVWSSKTEADLQAYQLSFVHHRELSHALEAINIAKKQKILTSSSKWSLSDSSFKRATQGSEEDLARWSIAMEHEVQKINDDTAFLTNEGLSEMDDDGDVNVLTFSDMGAVDMVGMLVDHSSGGDKEVLESINVTELNMEQKRAYEIVAKHLEDTLNGQHPSQLLMIIYGEGGTGKSRVIQTITKEFERRGVGPMLCKGAFTGVAASLIEGKTLHVLAGVPVRGDGISAQRRRMLEKFWTSKAYMIVDEISMVSRCLFAKMSRSIRTAAGTQDSASPFGGKNVIVAGDFHQFPPVVSSSRAALYHPVSTKDTIDDNLGRQLYEEFKTVIILKEQKRVTDPIWQDLLRHARHGSCSAEHLRILRSLLVSNESGEKINYEEPPWDNATLLTPRHHVRIQWNQVAAEQHCKRAGRPLLICPANDKIFGEDATMQQRFFIANQKGRNNKPGEHGRLQDFVQLAIGLKVMVTWNIQTDLDLANGSQGVITDIVLDEAEPDPEPMDRIVYLKKLPKYILVKLTKSRIPSIGGLPQGVIPIIPLKRSFVISIGKKKVTVQRTQLPITLAYAITDMRGQGQTLDPLIADIGKVPSGGQLTAFSGYVALSRAPGRANIRLLRDFEDKIFTQHPSQYLRDEDARLERLDRITANQFNDVHQLG